MKRLEIWNRNISNASLIIRLYMCALFSFWPLSSCHGKPTSWSWTNSLMLTNFYFLVNFFIYKNLKIIDFLLYMWKSNGCLVIRNFFDFKRWKRKLFFWIYFHYIPFSFYLNSLIVISNVSVVFHAIQVILLFNWRKKNIKILIF